MAIARSLLHRSLRGAVGDFIFRNYNGKTVVSLRPVYKNETNTEARRQARGRFREATMFASNAMANPKLKMYYMQKAKQLKLPNAYTAAITDYLRKAKVSAATRSSFAAKKGVTILVKVNKGVFRISKIKASLYNNKGELLIQQELTLREEHKTYLFTLPTDLPDYATLKIITDEPNEKEYIIAAEKFLRMDWK